MKHVGNIFATTQNSKFKWLKAQKKVLRNLSTNFWMRWLWVFSLVGYEDLLEKVTLLWDVYLIELPYVFELAPRLRHETTFR